MIAHNVSVPLYKHRSKEFSDRMYFMAKRFDGVHIISKERNISDKDRIPVKDELAPNLVVHKVHNGLVSSNLDILRVVRDVGADAIFADGIGHAVSSILCKRKCGIPLVTFIHGFEADLKAIRLKLKLGLKPTPGLLSKILAVYDAIVLRASDEVLCVSPGLVEYARKLVPRKDWNKIKIIPQSFEYVKYVPKEAAMWADDVTYSLKTRNKHEVLLITVIGMGATKGTDIALRTHKYIAEKKPGAVMIAVSKTINPKYVRMAKELKLKNNALFLQNLPRDQLLALLSHSSILLCPSFSEGFSRAISEAMVLGVPVVAYVNKSLTDAVSKGAVVGVRTTNPKDYARECISLIRGEKLREELIQKAKGYIRPLVLFPEKKRFELICNNIDQVLSTRH